MECKSRMNFGVANIYYTKGKRGNISFTRLSYLTRKESSSE